MKKKKIAVIGGGTGTFAALSGLKAYPLDLAAVITMMDSGGSTGRLRDQLGVLPPGDLRQALVALSSSEKIWRDLFVYRFENGDLQGHNFGNIFISVLEKITGSINEAVELASIILQTEGKAIPVTFDKVDLHVDLADGKTIKGETHIDEPKEMERRARIVKAYLKPKAKANKEALKAIREADAIVIGPGDLYTSIIPNLLVEGVKKALAHSKAKKFFVLNLMTKYGQTTDYTAKDHLEDLKKYLPGRLDVVLVNKEKPSKKALAWYLKSNEVMVQDDLNHSPRPKVVRKNLISEALIEKGKSDKLRRSLIRHDPQKLARGLYSLL